MRHASLAAPVYNVCTGHETRILTLAQVMGELLQSTADISFAKQRPGDIRRSLGSPALATSALVVAAEVSLRDGLSHLLTDLRIGGSD